jgi:diguanylate cyclase (GGDEF)-like protein/PAS domain S-box-containing protein
MTTSRLASAELYRCAFEGMCDPILLLKDGRIVDCNAAALKMLGGINKSKFLKSAPSDISPACQPDGRASGEKSEEMIAAALRDGFHRFEWVHSRADGSNFLVEISLTPITVDGEVLLLTLWHDITERKQAERFELFRSHTLELLTGDEPLPVILEAIVLGVEQLNPAELCSILLLDRNGKHLLKGAAPSLPDFYNAAIDGIEIGIGVGSCGTAAFTGERVIVDDIATHPYWAPYKELAAKAGLGACWSQPIRSSSGQVLGTFAIYHHATHTPTETDLYLIEQAAHLASIAIERSVAAEKLRDSEAHYRLLTEDATDVIWKMDSELHFTYISPADELLRGYKADEVVGHHVFEMFTDEGVATVRKMMRQRQAMEQQGTKAGFMNFEAQHRCKDGSLIWGEVFSTPEYDAQGTITGYHGITREISKRKQMEEQVRQLAFHDSLTNLPNRRLLYDRLNQSMAASKRSGRYNALMFLDLDNFKLLNDIHGHVAGDLLLIVATDRLKKSVRAMDTVARFGGDEFVVMLNELDVDKDASAVMALNVAEKIRLTLSAPYLLAISGDGKTDITIEHHCTASIGVVVFINHEMSQDDILRRADATMYKAKEAGRNLIRFYDGNI